MSSSQLNFLIINHCLIGGGGPVETFHRTGADSVDEGTTAAPAPEALLAPKNIDFGSIWGPKTAKTSVREGPGKSDDFRARFGTQKWSLQTVPGRPI